MAEKATAFENADFYDADDGAEYLAHTDVGDALASWLEQRSDDDPEVTIYAFGRSVVTDKWIKAEAIRLAESMSEAWSEEYGDPDGRHEVDAGALTNALLPVVAAAARGVDVWRCEQVAKRDFTFAEAQAICAPATTAVIEPSRD